MLTSTCGARPPHQTTTDAMREPPAVSLVCCDLASLVIDSSIVERAFAEAIATQGIVVGTQDYVRSMVRLDRARGRPPAAVLQEIFDGDEPRAQAASLAFDRSFRAAAERYGMTVPPDVVAALTRRLRRAPRSACSPGCPAPPVATSSTSCAAGASPTLRCARTTRRAASRGRTSCSPRCCGSERPTSGRSRWSAPPRTACCRAGRLAPGS